jgi:hypothetical protein
MTEESGQEAKDEGSVSAETLQKLFMLSTDDEYKLFLDELNTQNPRGLAVLGVAYLEWRTREAIKLRLTVNDKEADKLLGKEGKSGDLDFAEQCKLAYCLGLVGEDGLFDLNTLGQIRNKFAHGPLVRDFDHISVRDLCKNLRTLDKAPGLSGTGLAAAMKDKPAGRFAVTVHQLGSLISGSASHYLNPKTLGKVVKNNGKPVFPPSFW